MKLITVAALLFSTSVIAANQCKPDDICLKFESNRASKTIHCKSIKLASIENNDENRKALWVTVNRRNAIYKYAQDNHDEISKIHVMNDVFGLKIDENAKMDFMMILDSQHKNNAAETLVSCHNYLSSNKLLSNN